MSEILANGGSAGSPGTIRLAIADKNPVVRAGLEQLIGRDRRFEIISTVSTGGALMQLIEREPIGIAVVGWSLPDMTGGDVLVKARQAPKPIRIIIYTGDTSPDVLRQAIKSGAWGFVAKSEEPSVLLESIAMVARGRLSLPYVDIDSLNHDPLEELTARERELLGGARQRLDQPADCSTHRHFAQHGEISLKKSL